MHFAFFVWACRRVDVKRRLERRESCNRCLAMQLREKMASRGSDIEPMPSRAYHKLQDGHIRISPTATSPTITSPSKHIKTPPTRPTASSPSFSSSVYTETVPYPPVGAKYHELDVEQKHIPYLPSSPRRPQYVFEDSDDDEPPPPTPPPKPQYRERAERPPLPKLDVGPYQTSKRQNLRRGESKMGAPGRAYSISSYYYSNHNEV